VGSFDSCFACAVSYFHSNKHDLYTVLSARFNFNGTLIKIMYRTFMEQAYIALASFFRLQFVSAVVIRSHCGMDHDITRTRRLVAVRFCVPLCLQNLKSHPCLLILASSSSWDRVQLIIITLTSQDVEGSLPHTCSDVFMAPLCCRQCSIKHHHSVLPTLPWSSLLLNPHLRCRVSFVPQ
jgi:hypothetical protein